MMKFTGCVTGILVVASSAVGIEVPNYTTVVTDGAFEVRDYPPHIVAETRVAASREEAGNEAFRRLFRYISGGNAATNKIKMTAPVGQVALPDKVTTAPSASDSQAGSSWIVSFMMPSTWTMTTLPVPKDSAVALREIPARRMAAVRYSGRWTETLYDKHHTQLVNWMQEQGLTPAGPPEWARYNAPFTLPFMRRNEILIPIAVEDRG